MRCTSIIPAPQRKWNCDKFQTSQECAAFEICLWRQMFFHQSTFTENSTIITWKNEEPKNLNHDSLHTKSHSFWSLSKNNRAATPRKQACHCEAGRRWLTENALQHGVRVRTQLWTQTFKHSTSRSSSDQSRGTFKAGIHWVCYSHYSYTDVYILKEISHQ